MIERDALKEALGESMENEVREAEALMQTQSPYVFSDAFETSMQKLIDHQSRGDVSDDFKIYLPDPVISRSTDHRSCNAGNTDRRYITLKGKRIRRAVLAAIIAALIFAMSITALAVIKPGIYYKIRELIGYLDIVPQYEERPEDAPDFTPVMPAAPEGYQETEETHTADSFSIEYRDDQGHIISIYQFVPDGSRVYQDAGEGERKEYINGHEALITEQEDITTIITDNGESVIILSGTCDYEDLHDLALQLTKQYD